MFGVPRIARLIATVALTAIAGAASVAKDVFTPKAVDRPQEPRVRGSTNRRRPTGFGNRHVQRMARKRKNQARHKAHCRRQSGFTVIELLISLAIVGILLALVAGYVDHTRQVSYGFNGMVETRCIDGSKWVISRSGMATQVLDKNGRSIACPLT